MKVFVDTNVLVAAYATHGACNELIHHCIALHVVYISDFVLNELEDKLLRKIKLSVEETALIIRFLRHHCTITQEALPLRRISRDHDDDHILAAAIASDVSCIITGDKDLLVLKEIDKIPIVTPTDFWKLELMENILGTDTDR